MDPADDGGRDVVWLRGITPRGSRRAEPLTLARIVAVAVAELDVHGAERLTMRRLAQRLEVTSTALYWHVATKDDLLDLALDEVLGEVPIPDADDPRAAVRALLGDWRAVLLAHPWSPALLGRPLLGPNMLARTEFLQATLTRAGLAGRDLAAAGSLLSQFVIGAAVTESTWRRAQDPTALSRVQEYLAARADLYPTLDGSGFVERSRWTEDELFALGLDRVLDTVLA
ncbi:TetR/AcrR family transcriptional regulator C-terminal domain-containing protein [Actinomycetospora lutea]|uniref:TetR/AcrR family transcriptional regulator C-terminal domain-containing protein n=1 Tax=Actinomycetospora lutea TaxID=663604 RepID=UPI002366D18B|nr:TetR/AcrR family transcriptional regulator C-terminal domain-containing protein [Actinomycetospora lutea]MDD7941545.1 TetR/AcrR family transcriptional regulator C-terminal domain-containing protein [Actinomycetospora lutea]